MALEPTTQYKLLILYMLNKVNFPLTNAQISGFFLDKEYTHYFVLQEVISDLLDKSLISVESSVNTSYYHITTEGVETLSYFVKKIPITMIDDVDIFLSDNKFELKNEVGTMADYYKTTNGDYIVHCKVHEGKSTLIEIKLSVPEAAEASSMCANWKQSCQEIYSNIMGHLLKSE